MPTYDILVTPAYGRDYTNAAAAKYDWDAGLDFVVSDTIRGRCYTSKRDWAGKYVAIRYNKLTQITIVKG